MSDQSDGTDRAENIDVIRDLLRKLEEVAVKDGEQQTSKSTAIVVAPLAQLSTLQRTSSQPSTAQSGAAARPPSLPMPEFSQRPSTDIVPIEMLTDTALSTSTQHRRRGLGVAIAALSFAFGIACAVGIIFAFDPLKQFQASPRQAAGQQISPPIPSAPSPVESAAVAPPVAIEQSVTAAPSPAHSPVEPAAQPSATSPTSALPRAEPRLTLPVEPPPVPTPELAAKPALPVVSDANLTKPPPAAKPPSYSLLVPARLSVRAGERRPLGLRIEPMPDEMASLLVVVRSMPPWMMLSKGSTLGNEVWFMPAHMTGDLDVELGSAAEGAAEFKVQLATIDGRILTEAAMTVVVARLLGPSTAPLIASPTDLGEPGLTRLLARGELLIDTGEVEAARTLLRTAAEAGSVAAALKLAETYDPAEVQRLGMTVASADPSLAARWYERAEALGSQVASTRLATLGRR